MEARAWRLAAGAAGALLALLALVGWRSSQLDGGWLLALRLTALLAVAGLLGTVLVAGRAALRPPARREVVVRLPARGEPTTQVEPAPAGADRLPAALLLAVLSAAPVLVVLALAAPGQASEVAAGAAAPAPSPGGATSTGGGSSAAQEPSAPPSSSSPPSSPSSSPPSSPSSSPSASGPPAPPAVVAPQPPASPDDVAAAPTPAPLPAACEVVVQRGDSLWAIAARQLGPDAAPGAVAERWRALYAGNRAVVGDDPDLVLPGQLLRTCG
ncbi:LysM peptidoglycan-binding domain-containing protein [Quadrisphaera sp. DSM 44207]|uniref:LysM peptidoglycan-binding domain-containing protein n=1 Tax=Quadrisphaera sp. DSM 44207 TaxID=1881057 RepID=UPI000887699B|nr:LysM peptidoglycan-binding domain-containing protein [Quadrisphaera sp. DSM 44207]SDQ69432.1 hypothetical protein SAMN05428996_2424 [Quadrisphaera sp. DSM 44207]